MIGSAKFFVALRTSEMRFWVAQNKTVPIEILEGG